MSIEWTRVIYSLVITRQSNPPISQFNSPCNEFTSFWSMFLYNKPFVSLCSIHVAIELLQPRYKLSTVDSLFNKELTHAVNHN